MKNRALIFVFTIMGMNCLFAQNPKIDSLKNRIDQFEIDDTNRVHALVEYAAETYNDDALSGKEYILEALQLSKEMGYARGYGFSHVTMSGYFYMKSQLDSALHYAIEGVRILDSIGDQRHILAGYNNMAMIYNNQGKTDLAIATYHKIYNQISSEEPSVQQIAISNNLALAFIKKEDYKNAKRWFENVVSIAEDMELMMGLIFGYNGLCIVETNLNNLEAAKSYGEQALRLSKSSNMLKVEMESLLNLGKVHQKLKNYNQSEDYLFKSREIADSIKTIRTLIEINKVLVNLYKEKGEFNKALSAQEQLYLFKDSVFNMEKTEMMETLEAEFHTKEAIKEKEIAKLESERFKQNELIAKQKAEARFRWLVGLLLVFLIVVFIILLYVRQFRIKKKNEVLQVELEASRKRLQLAEERKNAELKAIKAQMNPHFLFNALNSIQEYIILNEKDLATEYLGKFADLVRKYLDQSNEMFVTLEEEIETLQLYIDLESLRQEDITTEIDVEDEIITDEITVPPLLIQPYVENAFKHGLWHKKDNKKLWLKFELTNGLLVCKIIDNGVGRAKSEAINSSKHQSFSTKANEQRLNLIKERFGDQIGVQIDDRLINNEVVGTIVTLSIPKKLI